MPSQDSAERKQEDEKSLSEVSRTNVNCRSTSSLWFIGHGFLSKEGGGGQLVIFHCV